MTSSTITLSQACPPCPLVLFLFHFPCIRPPDIYSCRRTYILPGILSFFVFFRRLISELAERNSTKIGHMVESKCNLKTHVRHLGYPLSLQIGGLKITVFGRLRNLTATSTVYVFGKETQYRQSVKCVANYKDSSISSQNDMNFGPQTASNWTIVSTHPP